MKWGNFAAGWIWNHRIGWRLGDNRWLSWLLPAFFVNELLVLIIVVLLPKRQGGGLAGAFGGAGIRRHSGREVRRQFFSQATRGARLCSCLRDGAGFGAWTAQ